MLSCICWSSGYLASRKSNDKRSHVGKVMQCIGDQCETSRQDAPNYLGNGPQTIGPNGNADTPVIVDPEIKTMV
jgi:hypothetical protein